jgi:hypothetical protein
MPTRHLPRWSLLALALCSAHLAAWADVYDNEAAKARAINSGTVIKCSPNGGDGTVAAAEALRALKPGTILQLHPGTYESALVIGTDKVIIEGGSPGGYCEAKIELSGKDCVIRNLWANHLELSSNAVVVDSVFNYVCTPETQAKADCILYNSCCRAIFLGNERNSLAIIDSTVLQDANSCFAIASRKTGTFRLRNSIVYAKYIAFRIANNPKLEIENSLIFGNAGLAKEDTYNARKKGATAMDLASFKKLSKCRAKGENLSEKPVFKRPSEKSAANGLLGYYDLNGRQMSWQENSEEAPDFYLLADNSPLITKGIGANLNEKGFPVPRAAESR